MDGQQGRLKRSLQKTLNHWILSATAVFALLIGAASAWVAFDEARELQDNQLQQIAAIFSSHSKQIAVPGDSDPEDAIIVQRLDASGHHDLPIPANLGDGLHTLSIKGVGWRVYIYDNGRFAVSQRTEFRDEVALASSLRTLLPMVLLAPILMAIVSFAVNKSFKPVLGLASLVDRRNETQLDPLPEHDVPVEIVPFVRSINRLLARLRQAIAQQQRFVADAAHELRTPVTALSLLAENLANAKTLNDAQARLLPLLEGLTRMQTLVTQLLDLARLHGEKPTELAPVAFDEVVKTVIADLHPLAEAKGIDLGMPRCETVLVSDINGRLSTLVRNAIENAIRYTPDRGVVDVSLFVDRGLAVLQIDDSGPGITEDEMENVFKPFHRVGNNTEPGNGLGLAISQEIAVQLGGEIRLSNRKIGGLRFQYTTKTVPPRPSPIHHDKE